LFGVFYTNDALFSSWFLSFKDLLNLFLFGADKGALNARAAKLCSAETSIIVFIHLLFPPNQMLSRNCPRGNDRLQLLVMIYFAFFKREIVLSIITSISPPDLVMVSANSGLNIGAMLFAFKRAIITLPCWV